MKFLYGPANLELDDSNVTKYDFFRIQDVGRGGYIEKRFWP